MPATLSPVVYTWLCGAFVSLGSVTLGYDLGIIASVIPCQDFFVRMGIPTPSQIGLIVSLMVLGAFTSNLFVGYMADTLGRRRSIIIGCLVFFIGGALQTSAKHIGYMFAGRYIAGLGIGMLTMLAPLYQSEIAHPSMRGRLTSLQQFFLGIGALVASFIGYGCFSRLTGEAQWRVQLGIQLLPAIPLALFVLLLPESPRYLAIHGQTDAALLALARLHARGDTADPFVRAQHAEMLEEIAAERSAGPATYAELLATPTLLRRVVLGCALQAGLQLTGISAIEYYSPDVFAAMGFDTKTTLALQAGNSVLALVAEVLCIAYIDRLGRRRPLIWSFALSGASFVVIAALAGAFGTRSPAASRAFVAVTWFYNFVFSFAVGPLAWAVPVEMFGSRHRSKATGITSSAQWIFNFMIAQVTPIALQHIGWRYWIVFAVCGAGSAVWTWAFLPETRGLPLEEVDAYFAKVPLFVPHSTVPVPGRVEREDALRQRGAEIVDDKGEESVDEKVPVEA